MNHYDALREALRVNTEQLRVTREDPERRELLRQRVGIKYLLLGEPRGLSLEAVTRAVRESGMTIDMERARELHEEFFRTYPALGRGGKTLPKDN